MKGIGALGIGGVLVLGAALIWWGTDGLSVFTAETARREAIARNPRPLPVIAFEDETGAATALERLRGKAVLVDFVYTRCPTVCNAQGSDFEQAREAIERAGLAERVALLTISFDPEHDGPEQLAEYADRYGGADPVWQFVRATPDATRQLLQAAQVIVIPDGMGGFVHNAAIHVLDPEGRLVRILDSDAWEAALALAQQLS